MKRFAVIPVLLSSAIIFYNMDKQKYKTSVGTQHWFVGYLYVS